MSTCRERHRDSYLSACKNSRNHFLGLNVTSDLVERGSSYPIRYRLIAWAHPRDTSCLHSPPLRNLVVVMAEVKNLAVACSCGLARYDFSVPTSSLPLATYLCSCDISRRISGSLLTSYFRIEDGIDSKKPDLDNLTPYKSSEILTRHFCTTCGTQMYVDQFNRLLDMV